MFEIAVIWSTINLICIVLVLYVMYVVYSQLPDIVEAAISTQVRLQDDRIRKRFSTSDGVSQEAPGPAPDPSPMLIAGVAGRPYRG